MTLLVEMLVGETHDSLDNHPEVPMSGLDRVHKKSSTCISDLNAALTGMVNSIVTALSTQLPVPSSGAVFISKPPRKSVLSWFLPDMIPEQIIRG